MDCPYHEVKQINVCRASTRQMETRRIDEDDYCTTGEHDRCPMLLGFMLRGGVVDFRKAN